MLQWPWKKKKQPPAEYSEAVQPAPPVWEPPEEEMLPDRPVPFGYKTGWLCIRSDDPLAVIEALGLRDAAPCNWKRGLESVWRDGMLFVSPALDGWVMVVGWIEEDLESLSALTGKFSEFQHFGSHRVSDYYAWAKFQDGRLLRAYAYAGCDGVVSWDQGPLTPEEIALGAERFPTKGEECDWDEVDFPDEETVLALAAAWGVDTSFSGKEYPPALGWLCGGPR